MTHTQTQGAEGAGTMVLLPLDDPSRRLSDSDLPPAMIRAGGDAFHRLKRDRSLDADSCSLAVGIYRAMTEAHAREIATLSPAPAATPGVPDSVRALSDIVEEWEEEGSVSLKRIRAAKKVISAHLAGQSTGQGAEDAEFAASQAAGAIMPLEWTLKRLETVQTSAQANRNVWLRNTAWNAIQWLGRLTAPDSTRTGPVETEAAAAHQRDMALEALHTLGVRMGLLDPNVACDGPQLLAAIDAYSDELAARPEAPSDAGWRERVRHVKRGTEYEVLGEAEAQVANGNPGDLGQWLPIRDGSLLTVYRCTKTGKLWCRFTDEFRDGRFETINLPSDPAPSGQAEG